MGKDKEENPTAEVEIEPTETPLPATSPELEEEFRELQAEMLEAATKIVFEVATCECEKREECGVFKAARNLSKVLKELQDAWRKSGAQTPARGFRRKRR